MIQSDNSQTGTASVVEERPASIANVPPLPQAAAGVSQRFGTIASFLEIPFMYKRLIVVSTMIGMLLGWLAIVTWPRAYESQAKLMIRVGRESVSLDPTATTSPTLTLQKTLEEEVISALEVLNSRQVAETVVDRLGADTILRGNLPGAPETGTPNEVSGTFEPVKGAIAGSLYDLLKNAGIKDPVSDRELAVSKLLGSLEIHSPKQSSVIVIGAKAESPRLAQAMVSEVTRSFLDEHLNAAVTRGSLEFFENQSAEIERRLDELVAGRNKFLHEHQIVSIESSRERLEQQYAGLDRDLAVATGELEQALSEIKDLEARVAATETEIVAVKNRESDATWSGMRQRVYNLELDQLNLASIYTPDHPKLVAVREALNGARKILAELDSERVDESTTPNPALVRLREELQSQQTRVVGLRSLIQEKSKQRSELDRQADQLLDFERELAQADRNIALTDANLQMLKQKWEEARVIDELHSQRISNVHVFQPATFAERAVSPKKPILAAGFVLLGMTTGLGLSFMRQASSPYLRTNDDVEYRLGVRVVSNIPRFARLEPLGLRKRTVFRERCQALLGEILLSQVRSGPARNGRSRGRSIGVIGVDNGVGASTLAANLALSSGVDYRMKTVLVDADSRLRSVSKLFGLNGKPGLVELINGSASHDECLQRAKNAPVDLVAPAADSCEDVLTSGAQEIIQALQAYQHNSDLLIVDLPAASQPDQAIALAQHLDCVVVVVEAERTQAEAADRLLRRLFDSDTEIIGVVLNKTRSYLPTLIRRFVAPQA